MGILKIGVVGCGRIGKLHTENLVFSVKGAEVAAIADVMMDDAKREWAKGLGIEKVGNEVGETNIALYIVFAHACCFTDDFC